MITLAAAGKEGQEHEAGNATERDEQAVGCKYISISRCDEAEYKKLEEWSTLYQAKKNAKDTPVCLTIAIWFPPADTTKPAFLKNAIALEKLGVWLLNTPTLFSNNLLLPYKGGLM